MKAFMIEWFSTDQQMYKQEYYLQTKAAFARFQMLEQYVKDSRPEITTIFVDNSDVESF